MDDAYSDRRAELGETGSRPIGICRLALDAADYNALDEVPLGDKEDDEDRNEGDDRHGHRTRNVRRVLGGQHTQAKLDGLRAQNKPVFVDATAAWCITCLVNEQAVLSRPTARIVRPPPTVRLRNR